MKNTNPRIDDLGRAYAGSQLQIQIYVNRRAEELSQKIIMGLPSFASLGPRIRWVSPLEKDNFAEYQDSTFLKACGFEILTDALRSFWPRGGPVWDALARVEYGEGHTKKGVLLVEAKSHPPEIYGNGCQASTKSRRKIEEALLLAKHWLGIKENIDWTGPLYQSANRMAHLYFFREIVNVPAWLVNIYFINDPHSPTDYKEWQKALTEVKADLGISGLGVPYMTDIFLKAGGRSELYSIPN